MERIFRNAFRLGKLCLLISSSCFKLRLALRNHRNAVDQELCAGNDHFVSRLDTLAHFVVIPNRFADGQRFLFGHEWSTVLRLGDESEVLTCQPGYGQARDFRAVASPPHDSSADELRLSQRIV